MDIGKLHVLMVHFPIALALAAVLADVLWAIWRKDFFRHAGFYCLLLAAIASIPTVITGHVYLHAQTYLTEYEEIGETHEDLATATLCVLLAAAALRTLQRYLPATLRRLWLPVYALLMAAVLVLIPLTGHYGGKLAFGADYMAGLFQ